MATSKGPSKKAKKQGTKKTPSADPVVGALEANTGSGSTNKPATGASKTRSVLRPYRKTKARSPEPGATPSDSKPVARSQESPVPAELPKSEGATSSESVDPPLDERIREFCEKRFRHTFGREWDEQLLPSHARAQSLKDCRIELSQSILSSLDTLLEMRRKIEENILSFEKALTKIDDQGPQIAQYDLKVVNRLLRAISEERAANRTHRGDIHPLENEENDVEEYGFYEAQGVGLQSLLKLANRLVVRNYILCYTFSTQDIGDIGEVASNPVDVAAQRDQLLLDLSKEESSLTMGERWDLFEALVLQSKAMQITETRTVLDDLVSRLLFQPSWRVSDAGQPRQPTNSEMAVVAILLGYGSPPSGTEKQFPRFYVDKVADAIRKIRIRKSAPEPKSSSEK